MHCKLQAGSNNMCYTKEVGFPAATSIVLQRTAHLATPTVVDSGVHLGVARPEELGNTLYDGPMRMRRATMSTVPILRGRGHRVAHPSIGDV